MQGQLTQSAPKRTGLRSIRNVYGPEIEKRKRELIARSLSRSPQTLHALARLHEDLLFVRAFPGAPQTLRAAEKALEQIEALLNKIPQRERAKLDDTGFSGSKTRHVFAFPIVQWLVRHRAGDVEIDWRGYVEDELLDPPLRAVARPTERDGFDSGEFSTREWIDLARRKDAATDLQWLIEALNAATGIDADQLWTAAAAPIEWDLSASRWSVTHNALRQAAPVMRKKMRRPTTDQVRRIATPLKKIRLLPARQARNMIDVARAALAVRCREVVSINYANPNEVHYCDLGEGAALAVIGAAPAYRMSVEANYGYLLLSNGVPIGYGGVTALYRQANTGINIFDPFRGSEAAFLWTEMLRAFQTLFGVRRFIVNGYQFGDGNPEAIKSGAYWFYYRLGFRPSAPAQQKRAAREAARLAKAPAQRSTAATLKALAQGDLVLDLPGFDDGDHFDEALLPSLGASAAQVLAAEPVASRKTAEQQVAAKLAAALGVRSMKNWPVSEQQAFAMLAPAVSIVPKLSNWTKTERRALVAMMRAKGHAEESAFARAMAAHPRFFQSLLHELKSQS